MRCPTVAANTSSILEVVRDAGILFDPSYKEDLIEAVKLLESDTDKRKDLITIGFKRESEFNWDRTARETKRVYEEVTQ